MEGEQWNAERKYFQFDIQLFTDFYNNIFFVRLISYAKALHYKEQEFHQDKSPQVFESLILINNKLQQKEAAEGLLEFVMANRNAADELKVF